MLWLLCVYILALLRQSLGKLSAYHYHQYGAFYGGFNVSPEGVSAGSPGVSTQWFRRVTAPEGDASVLNKAFRDGSFPEFGIMGSLRDQIALLSKVMSTLLLEDGYKEDLYELRKRLKALTEDARRPSMFQKALSMRRIQRVMDMLTIMDLTKSDYADKLYIDHILASPNRHVEEALVERTLLMMVIKLMDADEKLLKLFLRFHYAHFISTSNRREVKTHLCPDTAQLLSVIAMKACQSKKAVLKNAMKWYFEDLVSEKSLRNDLIKAVAFEMDGQWGERGRQCIKSLLDEDRYINYDRLKAFPILEPVQKGRLFLRHSPNISPYSALFSVNVTSRDGTIEARPAAQDLDSSLDGMSVKIRFVKESVKIEPVNSRFLVFRLRTYRPVGTEAEPPTIVNSEAGEEEPGTSNDYDDADSSKPDADTTEDIVESEDVKESSSDDISSTKRLKIPNSADNIEYDTFICTYADSCDAIPVLPDDIVLMIQHPAARKLSVKERDALIEAWYGTGRERLLQIAATFPNFLLYHVALVERQ